MKVALVFLSVFIFSLDLPLSMYWDFNLLLLLLCYSLSVFLFSLCSNLLRKFFLSTYSFSHYFSLYLQQSKKHHQRSKLDCLPNIHKAENSLKLQLLDYRRSVKTTVSSLSIHVNSSLQTTRAISVGKETIVIFRHLDSKVWFGQSIQQSTMFRR